MYGYLKIFSNLFLLYLQVSSGVCIAPSPDLNVSSQIVSFSSSDYKQFTSDVIPRPPTPPVISESEPNTASNEENIKRDEVHHAEGQNMEWQSTGRISFLRHFLESLLLLT